MPAFNYKARDSSGQVVSGTIIAETEREVLFNLDKQGLFPVELSGAAESTRAEKKAARRVRPADIVNFTRELADLLRAGLSIDRALGVIAENAPNPTLSDLVDGLRQDVSKGTALSHALARHPRHFPPFYVSMIRAAETGGFLEDVLMRISLFQEKDEELRSRIRTALAYPILLLIVGTAAVIFLMVYFIPQFSKVFENFQANLPGITLLLIGMSDGLRRYGLFLLAGLFLGGYLLRGFLRTPRGQRVQAAVLLRTWVLGDVVRKRAISRFSRTLGTMLKSGVPILEGLTIAKQAMGNLLLMEEIEEAASAVKRGEKLGQLLGRARYFPRMLASMITVGEESGNLDGVLVHIADSYDTQVDRSVKVFVSLFEPMMLVLMAALVGFIVIAMLMPVFTLSTIVK
jgi:type II secretory pathway component PulF